MARVHGCYVIKEALELKKKFGSTARVLAGGTDLLVHLKKKIITTDHIISLQRIESLTRITAHPQPSHPWRECMQCKPGRRFPARPAHL